jgi:hypothetical protein
MHEWLTVRLKPLANCVQYPTSAPASP